MRNNINDVTSVVFCAETARTCGEGGEDAVQLFVNGNHSNRKNINEQDFAGLIEYNRIDDRGSPVRLYLNGDRMVAWHDYEFDRGYIA